MIYTCIADGIRSPPAFFPKNKYKELMKMQNENTKRVWLYARIPGNDGETLRCIRECAAKAQQDNCNMSAPALTKDMAGCCAPATVK